MSNSSEDSVQAAQERARNLQTQTGISDATMEVIAIKKKQEDESRAASKEKQAVAEWKRRASTMNALAEQVRMVFMQLQNDVNSMSLDRLVVKIIDS
jgi:hypothetical protein